MANVSFYANELDCANVVTWVNSEPDLAYILPDGEHRWRAVKSVDASIIYGKPLFVWNIPSGPLPLYRQDGSHIPIEKPWEGWRELKTGADTSRPWFGSAFVGVFHLTIQPLSAYLYPAGVYPPQGSVEATPDQRVIGRSDFGWVGKAYKPKAETTACWKRIERFIYGIGVPVDAWGWSKPGSNPTPDSVADDRDYVALPGALAEMKSGIPWNPYPGI